MKNCIKKGVLENTIFYSLNMLLTAKIKRSNKSFTEQVFGREKKYVSLLRSAVVLGAGDMSGGALSFSWAFSRPG